MLWWTLRKLESEDPEKRLQAVDELRRTGGREAAEHLVRTLSDPDVRVRDGAGEALAAIGGPQMVDVCIATLLTSENLTARLNAARALGFLGDPTATGVLSDRLARDPHPAIRQVAGLSLAALGWAPSSTDERIRLAMARGAWAEAAAEGPAAVEYLLDVVFDSPWYLRDGLDAALAEIGEPALRALDAGPETHEGWDAFAENAVAVRQTWRKLAERVHELRNERRAFDTREIRTERRSTLNIATDLGAHLADPNTGERFGGGPRDALGRFRGLCHECPRCGVEE